MGNLAKMVNGKTRSGPSCNSFYPTKPGEEPKAAITKKERVEATLLTHKAWTRDPKGKNCHFAELVEDEIGPCGIRIQTDKTFGPEALKEYMDSEPLDEETENRIKLAHNRIRPFIEKIANKIPTFTYPFKFSCVDGSFMDNSLHSNIEKVLTKGRGKARVNNFSIAVIGRFPPIVAEIYRIKSELHLSLRMIDRFTEQSLRICIPKGEGKVRPITVAADDLAFLNSIVQKSFQGQVKIRDWITSFRRGMGCTNSTLTDCPVKELALSSGDKYVAIFNNDLEKMFDRMTREVQALALTHIGAGRGFIEWQMSNCDRRTNLLVTDLFSEVINYE
jgi:hypothetical protein